MIYAVYKCIVTFMNNLTYNDIKNKLMVSVHYNQILFVFIIISVILSQIKCIKFK